MSVFMNDNYASKDPLALLTTEKFASMLSLYTTIDKYLYQSGQKFITLVPDIIFAVGGKMYKSDLTNIGESNLDTGSFVLGKDYYVYVCSTGEGQSEVYRISLNGTYPAGYTALNSRKIGGFHYGRYRSGGSVLVGIVPRSVWTLKHRPTCNPEGMVNFRGKEWVDIYLGSDDGAGGMESIYGGVPMTGTEGLCHYDFILRFAKVGKRLPSYDDYIAYASGAPQGNDGDNNNAWSATTNTGRGTNGSVANAVSDCGVVDAVGRVWENLDEYIHDPTGTSGAWYDPMAGKGFGQLWMYSATGLHMLIAGGDWSYGVHDGSRAVTLGVCPWVVSTGIGGRGVCDGI